jgi:hypothetical protein
MAKVLAPILAALIAASPGLATATVILLDGVHTINNEVNDSVVLGAVDTRPTLTVESGGHVTQGVRTVGRATLNVTGDGRVSAGSSPEAVWLGAVSQVRFADDAHISGDVNSDDVTPGRPNEANAFRRVVIEDQAVMEGNFRASGNLRLQDQATILGNISSSQTIAFMMTGGTVAGTVGGSGNIDHYLTLTGGSILGGVTHRTSWTHLDMSGGFVGGQGIATQGVLYADISGGEIVGGLSHVNGYNAGYVSITGGSLDATAGDWLISLGGTRGSSRLDIHGGQLGYGEAGLGIWLDDAVDFSIYGWGLSLTNGILSGYLSDGNWFSNALTFGANWRGQFQMHDVNVNVPEPGTSALLLLGLAAMGLQRTRRSRPAGHV